MFGAYNNFMTGFAGNFPGVPVFRNQQLPEINAVGTVTIEGCTVARGTVVCGSLRVDGSTLQNLTVTGASEVSNTTVNGAASFIGSLRSVLSHFNSPIEITSTEASLEGCTTRGIVVKPLQPPAQQSLTITRNTVVEGNITFEAGGGRVFVSDGAQINGNVIGGELRNTNNNAPN